MLRSMNRLFLGAMADLLHNEAIIRWMTLKNQSITRLTWIVSPIFMYYIMAIFISPFLSDQVIGPK